VVLDNACNANCASKGAPKVGALGFEPTTKRIQAQFQLGYDFASLAATP
jgi:hypothetical protein